MLTVLFTEQASWKWCVLFCDEGARSRRQTSSVLVEPLYGVSTVTFTTNPVDTNSVDAERAST